VEFEVQKLLEADEEAENVKNNILFIPFFDFPFSIFNFSIFIFLPPMPLL